MDASCPGGGPSCCGRGERRRGRAGTGVGRGRAELSFDFYDDWDFSSEGEGFEREGLLGWGTLSEDGAGAGVGGGYGTVAAQTTTAVQPGLRKTGGMRYPKGAGRRKSADGGIVDPNAAPVGKNGFWGRLFGGKSSRYTPTTADLQDHPGSRRLARDITEGEALLEESEASLTRTHRRARSGTQASHETASSYSSRGDLFPSDNEDDAVPLDDEFAMVLERRTTQSNGFDTEGSSNRTMPDQKKRGKRPSAGSRTSTRRTFSSRSSKSERERERRSRTNSYATQTVLDEGSVAAIVEAVGLKDEAFGKEALHAPSTTATADEHAPAPIPLSMSELKEQERELELEEEAAVERKRQEAFRAAEERGLVIPSHIKEQATGSFQADSNGGGALQAAGTTTSSEEPSQLPTPQETDDEEDRAPDTIDEESNALPDEDQRQNDSE